MKNKDIRDFWIGFFIAAIATGWLYWLWRKNREVMPEPLILAKRKPKLAPVKLSKEPKTTPDSLEVIRGIGPSYASLLNEEGITTYEQLAAMSPAELRQITGTTRWDPADWIAEAQQLAENE